MFTKLRIMIFSLRSYATIIDTSKKLLLQLPKNAKRPPKHRYSGGRFYISVYAKHSAISASTVVIGAMANVSTSTFNTPGETNAGSVGPSLMFLIPR